MEKKYARLSLDGEVLEVIEPLSGVPMQERFSPDFIADLIECPNDVEPGWVKAGKTFCKPIELDLEAIKASAVATIITMLETAADAYTGKSPLAERLSWATKQDAARAYQSGNASPDQIKMLEAEAFLTGETIDALAITILTAASTYWAAAGAISGLRRSLSAAIAAAETAEQVQSVLNGAQAQIELVFKGAQ